jgi:hypothetical protein
MYNPTAVFKVHQGQLALQAVQVPENLKLFHWRKQHGVAGRSGHSVLLKTLEQV